MQLNTIYNENCLEGMKRIPDQSVDAIICDLPYGTTSARWDSVIPFEPLWEQYERIIKPNRVIALFGCEPFSSLLRTSKLNLYKYDWIWDKHSTNGFLNAKKRPLKRYETISIFSIGCPVYYPQMEVRGKERDKGSHNRKKGNGDGVYGKFENLKKHNNIYYPTDVLSFSNAVHRGKIHPTQKPVDLLRYLIRTYTNEGEVILDNCMGSGTTAIAAMREKRNFIGFELDKEYYDLAMDRIEKEKQQLTLF